MLCRFSIKSNHWGSSLLGHKRCKRCTGSTNFPETATALKTLPNASSLVTFGESKYESPNGAGFKHAKATPGLNKLHLELQARHPQTERTSFASARPHRSNVCPKRLFDLKIGLGRSVSLSSLVRNLQPPKMLNKRSTSHKEENEYKS